MYKTGPPLRWLVIRWNDSHENNKMWWDALTSKGLGAGDGVKYSFFQTLSFHLSSLFHIFNAKYLIALLSYPLSHLPTLPHYCSVLFSLKKKKKKQGLKHPPLSSRLLRAMMEKVFYEAFFGFTHSREEKVILINFYYVSGLSHFFICQAV